MTMSNSEITWNDLLFLDGQQNPAAYLKMMTLLMNVEVKAVAEVGVFRGATSRLLRALFPTAASLAPLRRLPLRQGRTHFPGER
jgi:hypothetical protein